MIRAQFFEGRLCESNVSYEFFPRKETHFPLDKLGREMENAGLLCDIKTAFVITFKMNGTNMSLYPSGKILIKNVNVEKDAKKVFEGVLKVLNKCPSAPKV